MSFLRRIIAAISIEEIMYPIVDFSATVCKTVRPVLSVRCLSCVHVMLVYCGQTVGWIKMKLGVEVGLGHGHIVLDGDPDPPSPKGHRPQFSAHVLWPSGWMDQDATWYVGRPQSRPHCVRCGPCSPKRVQPPPPPIFGPYLLWPNGRPSQLLLSTC